MSPVPPPVALAWQALAAALPLPLWLVDARGLRIAYANPAAEQLVGRSAAQMAGQPVHGLTAAPQDQIFWSRPLVEVAAGIHSYTSVAHAGTGHMVAVERCVQALQQPGEPGSEPHWLVLTMQDRTEHEHAQRELEMLLSELRATLDCAADGIMSCDLQGGIRALNQRLAQLWQLPDALLTQRDDRAILAHIQAQVVEPPDYGARLMALLQEPLRETVDLLQLRTGMTLEQRSVPRLIQGRPAGRVHFFRDISPQVQAEAGLKLAAQVFESSLDAIFIADERHQVARINPAGEQMLGTPGAALVGLPVTDLLEAGMAHEALLAAVHRSWADREFWAGDVAVRSNHEAVATPVHLSWVVLRDGHGAVSRSIGFMRDLTPQRAAQQRIEELAFTDALTGLPNRLRLGEHVSAAIAKAGALGEEFALLFLDLDRFKIVNDSLGHPFGDRVLQLVARRLQGCLRQSDMLCRLGGDEFVIHLHGASAAVAESVARRILEEMLRPFELDGMGFSIQASIGIALFPHDGRLLEDLVKHADAAMYRVKERGRGNYGFYQPQLNANLLSRMKLEHAMRQALEQGHMAVHYQPQVHLASGRIVGAEALLRWRDPELGPVSPATFIPLAEECGYIVTLGAWVLRQAIEEASQWRANGRELTISVNVSALEFRQAGFTERIAVLLNQHGLPAHLLQLELTESVLLHDAQEMRQVLDELARIGVGLSIDDFGTGYSSLAYLRQLKIQRLKIDKSFIDGLTQDAGARAIVQAILSMGSALGIVVVAEGVETQEQCDLLHTMECAQYQGYLCAPALSGPDLRALVAQQAHESCAGARPLGTQERAKVSANTTGPAS